MKTLVKTTLKQQWLEVLRSGQYDQCHGSMGDSNKTYCAMGLLHVSMGDPYFEKLTNLVPNKIFTTVADLNDSGHTFSQIADLIETRLSDDLQSFQYGN